jgi:DNA-binding Lrp family transcriptional regulator
MSKAKVSEDDYIDPTYKKWVSSNKSEGRLIQIIRIIARQPATVEQISKQTNLSLSQIRKLVKIAEKEDYIKRNIPSSTKRSPGRPLSTKHEEVTGRPEHSFSITGNGRWLMRLDPELRDTWEEIQRNYPKNQTRSVFDSYANIIYGIKKSESLKRFEKFEKDYQSFDHLLEMQVLRPFLFTYNSKEVDSVKCHDELVDVIEKYALPQHRLLYYQTLEDSLSKLLREIEMHKTLMDKMKKIPEVSEYLGKKNQLSS